MTQYAYSSELISRKEQVKSTSFSSSAASSSTNPREEANELLRKSSSAALKWSNIPKVISLYKKCLIGATAEESAVRHYHPDKIDTRAHGMKWKVHCEEAVKYLNAAHECFKA